MSNGAERPEKAEDEAMSNLNAQQDARIAALWQACSLLVAETLVGPFGENTEGRPLGDHRDYETDLVSVAEYILSGLLSAQADDVVFEPSVAHDHRCACVIAGEVTGGEKDIPKLDDESLDIAEGF